MPKSKSSKFQCLKCMGTGYVKCIPVVCPNCKGKTCISCKSTGLSVLPYETCYVCFGSGEIEQIEQTTQKTNLNKI